MELEAQKSEIDTLLANGVFEGCYSYSVVFGCSKLINGEREATIIISLYKTRFEPVQRKYTGRTIGEAMEHVKKFVEYGDHIQMPERIDGSAKSKPSVTLNL